jgi:hypothetical protein
MNIVLLRDVADDAVSTVLTRNGRDALRRPCDERNACTPCAQLPHERKSKSRCTAR